MNLFCWQIELMGGLRAQRIGAPDEAPVESFRTRKTASLLAFLAWHRGWHARDVLAEQLWPEANIDRARNSLRVALSALRELLPDDQNLGVQTLDAQALDAQVLGCSAPSSRALETNHRQARLSPQARTDVEAFRVLAARGQVAGEGDARLGALEAAVALVKGPLLPGFYDDWILPAQTQLEDEFLVALRALIALREARGDLMGALDAARRGAAVAPLREGVMRDIVRLGLACNENSNARAEFEAWRARVARVDDQLQSPNWESWTQSNGLTSARTNNRNGANREIRKEFSANRDGAERDGANRDGANRDGANRIGANRIDGRWAPGSAPNQEAGDSFRALPAPLASFVGRCQEKRVLGQWLGEAATRLVTLIGPGGGGKTRLALELAREIQSQARGAAGQAAFDGVAWASLEALPSSRLVPGALLDALGAHHGSETVATVAAAIQARAATSGRRVLLVIDNCEHLHGLAQVLAQLLNTAPALVIAATSRSPLQLSGERLFWLHPFDIAPTTGNAPRRTPQNQPSARQSARRDDANALTNATANATATNTAFSDAVQLFVERARLVQPALDLSPASLESMSGICAHLGGLPLAIEIAAARVALFSPAQMNGELERLARLHTHENCVTATSKIAAISDFATPNPVTSDVAAPNAVASDVAASGAVTLGIAAIDASPGMAATGVVAPLDWPNSNRDAPDRHRSLRTAIAWSYGQLPPVAARLWAQLSVFHDGFGVEAASALCPELPVPTLLLALRDSSLLLLEPGALQGTAPRGVWVESLRAFAAEQLTPEQTRALRARHANYFLGWIEDLAPQLDGASGARVRASLEREAANVRAALAWFLGEGDDIEGALRACAALWPHWETSGQNAFSRATLEATLQAAARAFPEPDDGDGDDASVEGALKRRLHLRAQCYEGAGKLAHFFSDPERAQEYLGHGLRLFRRVGDEVSAANCLYSLGFGALKSGDLESARALCEQSLAIHRRRRDTQMMGDSLYNLSLVALVAGDYPLVRELSQERLTLHRASGDRRGVAISLENLGLAALFSGEVEAANAYFSESLVSFEALNESTSVARALWGLGQVESMRGDAVAARAHFERALLLVRATQNTWGYPYLMEAFGALCAEAGQWERAVRLLSGAANWRQTQGEPLPQGPMRAIFEAQCQRARQHLGISTFEALWTLGATMPIEALLDSMKS